MKKLLLNSVVLLLLFSFGCKEEKELKEPPVSENLAGKEIPIEHASGLSITDYGEFKILEIAHPWPNAQAPFRYLLAKEGAVVPGELSYDFRVNIPVKKLVATSTTHIPSLENLGVENTLIGFPGLDYISSPSTRKLIEQGKIKELGRTEALNTEQLLALQPDVVIGFSIDGANKSLNNIGKSGIPVVYNGDWTETSPLGKAEWIKFFGAFYDKLEEATAFFKEVETAYLEAKELAGTAGSTPTVIAGAMYKDQWYLPAGQSWQASFLKDANADYLFKASPGTGSLSLSVETVLAKGANAQYWIGPAQFTSYEQLLLSSPHYRQFAAFEDKNIYTFSSEKGETGGVIFYELAPNRPDLVLKDLISILHPQLLPEYKSSFYKPLK
jgi:iron complex transport system substrate-binding protein